MRGGKRNGAGRKPGTPMVMYQIRLPADLKAILTAMGAKAVRDKLEEIAKGG